MDSALNARPVTKRRTKETKKLEAVSIPLGVFSQAVMYTLVGTYAMYYFTDIIGFHPMAVGTLFLVARIWDAVNDPLFGVIADKTKSRWGKFKPYLLFAPLWASVFGILIFTMPQMTMTGKFIYASFVYVLFSMAYTVLDIPLWAAPAVITTDEKKITSLISRNQLFSFAGTIGALVLTMMLVEALGGEKGGGFRNTAIVFGILAFVLTTMAGIVMKERVSDSKDKAKIRIREIYKVAIKNKYLMIGLFSSTLINTVHGIKSMVATYYAANNLGDIGLLPVIMLAVSVPGLIGILCTPVFVRLFGKKKMSFFAIIAAVAFSVAAFFTGYEDLVLALAFHGAFSFFAFISTVIFTTVFADAVTYGEWKHGVRAEGTIFAFRTLNGKIANAFSPFLLGMLLVGFGYVADAGQTPAALSGLHLTITIVPAIIIVLCCVPMLFYSLTHHSTEAMQQEIKKRTEKGEPIPGH